MRIKVSLRKNGGIELPIAYRSILQGVIYNAIRFDEKYGRIHDEGYSYEKRQFRNFTFSDIFGKYSVDKGKITFNGKCEFWLSSSDKEFLDIISQAFLTNGIKLGENVIEEVEVEKMAINIEEDSIHIKMLSPICVCRTNKTTGKTRYYNPGDKEFEELIQANFKRKYKAIYGIEPESNVKILPELILPKHKKIIEYKGIIHEAWHGQYVLKGHTDYLTFLADVGIGSKNSKGFGLFEII